MTSVPAQAASVSLLCEGFGFDIDYQAKAVHMFSADVSGKRCGDLGTARAEISEDTITLTTYGGLAPDYWTINRYNSVATERAIGPRSGRYVTTYFRASHGSRLSGSSDKT